MQRSRKPGVSRTISGLGHICQLLGSSESGAYRRDACPRSRENCQHRTHHFPTSSRARIDYIGGSQREYDPGTRRGPLPGRFLMIEPSEQLARLRRRIAEVHERVAAKYPPKAQAPRQETASNETGARWFAEEWSRGEVVRNEFGEHFQTERLFPPHKRH